MQKFKNIILASCLIIAGVAHAAYDSSWYIDEFWSGEYPNGVAVVNTGVTIPARASMDLDVPADIKCALQQKAVYHPWNDSRPAQYFTASKIVPMIANEDIDYPAEPKNLVAKKGDQIDYLIYYAEGTFAVRYKAEEYAVDHGILEKLSYDENLLGKTDEWIKIPCVGGPEAWVLFRDFFDIDMNGDLVHKPGFGDWWPGFIDYGKVKDLD